MQTWKNYSFLQLYLSLYDEKNDYSSHESEIPIWTKAIAISMVTRQYIQWFFVIANKQFNPDETQKS